MKRVAVDKDFKKGFRKEEDVGALMMKKSEETFGYHIMMTLTFAANAKGNQKLRVAVLWIDAR